MISFHKLLKASLILCAFVACTAQPSPVTYEEMSPVTGIELHAAKLRKLHLVRPDLIPYPLALEVVC